MATQTQTVTLPETQQAVQIVEFNKPHELRTIPTPSVSDLRPHEVLIKIAASGLCHSDLEYLKGGFPLDLPVTACHEGTGTVIAFGSNMHRFKVGDRVVAGQTFGCCGDCEDCNGPEHSRHYCQNRETMMCAGGRNGAFQEYLVIDGREASKIPDAMSFATAAPLACAGMTAWRAVLNAKLKSGQWIGIMGSGGGLGHLAIQFAKKVHGLKVVAVDARDDGLALSKEMGADVVLDARKGKDAVVEGAKAATGKQGGVDATIELSGHPTAAETGAAIVRNHGRFVQVAIVDRVSIPVLEFLFRDIHVSGSLMASQKETEEMLHAVVKHKIHVENNIFDGLAVIPKVVEMLQNVQYRGKAAIVVDENAVGVRPGDGRV
ncbi:alcohol dehydrogenase [Neohortaea acidophila]|uniref:Alcohol dehydrogenase n=1 Tax=Neohortaea acidophila TaxID=245834 RepID=A0A6A6Q4I1_9PEZI|nr:alcohol dehydrogenase [Neohortaea acidophila]KAF2486307.1 alcohol dehydrogenase [Neohortaea acidophila]